MPKDAKIAKFWSRPFPKSWQVQWFDLNPLGGQRKPLPGWSRIVPVTPGCGEAGPGQNRDKSSPRPSGRNRPEPAVPTLPYRTRQRVLFWIRLGGRRGRRSRVEVEAERRQRRENTDRELDTLVAEFHRILPRSDAESVGIVYARYSSEFQHSIVDQVRAIFEAAVKLKIFIPREWVYYDIAVRGCKERRPGLDQVRAVLGKRAARTLLVFTTNRLFRKNYKCMKFVEEEVVGRGLRCVFVRTGIDTATTERWRLPLQMHAMVDEITATLYAENIRAAHEGLFDRRFVVSTIPFGYRGEDVEGPKTKRGLPRQIIVIDEETAEWVRTIFHWFVVDRLSQTRILERLNELTVPGGPQSNGTYWTDCALSYLLSNPSYRGQWAYGRGQNVWQPAADYAKRELRDKPLREKYFAELRIVSDEVWYKAQELLAASPQRNAGRKPRDGNTAIRPRDLNGLLICYEHQCPLKVGGGYGQYMYCQWCRNLPKGKRPLYSYLNRALALRLICRALADALRQDGNLIEELKRPFLTAAAALQAGEARSVDSLRKKSDRLTVQIEFVQGNPGETDRDREESKTRLRTLRGERAALDAEVARLTAAARQAERVPTEEEFREVIDTLEEVLLSACSGVSPADAGEFRRLLEHLTGGKIVIEQVGERRACRGWLRARVRLRLVETCADRLELLPSGPSQDREIVVDIREPRIAESQVEAVMALYGRGMLVTAIGESLGLDRHQVTDAVRIGHEQLGLPKPPDGRNRRATLLVKGLKAPLYQRLADEAKALLDQGLLIEEIAERLRCNRDTAHAALRYWFEQHGMPMPDMRTRRKSLPVKNRPGRRGSGTGSGEADG